MERCAKEAIMRFAKVITDCAGVILEAADVIKDAVTVVDDVENVSEEQEKRIYAVDFDGLLCVCDWPRIGAARMDVIEHFKTLKDKGHKLILHTCRERELLNNAIAWCAEHGLYFDAHNENLPEMIAKYGGDCRKIFADFYADDRNYNLEWAMMGETKEGERENGNKNIRTG